MRQHLFRIYREKLQSRRAETLAELLVSVLVIVLALTMFASALMAARRMLANGDQIINRYYAGRNRLELEESADTDPGAYKTKADLIFLVSHPMRLAIARPRPEPAILVERASSNR